MAVVIASNLRKELAGTVLFDGVSFSVERRDRVALSGPNGAGKTTLLRILAGETEKHGGELAFAKGTRVALHDQRPPLEQELTLREYVLAGARDLVALEEELRRLEQAMAEGDHAQATLNRYAEAQARLEHAGGYAWRDRAASVVRGLGFAEEDLDRPLRTFSGGELTRASLARALGGDPDLLLLDEPTNHLDVANLEWLERELAALDAAVILVAHDRWFLEAVTTATLELEAGRGTFFPGPWHAWRREKATRMLHAQKEVLRVQADIARLERFVERFRYKKSKAKQAQAKLTHIDRLEQERAAAAGEVSLLSRRTRGLGFEFLKPARSGRTVVEAEGLDVSVASNRLLLSQISFALERAEHVALVGPNGSGKTTLLEKLVRGDGVRIGHGVKVGYFSQQEMELDTRGSVLQCVQSMTGLSAPTRRTSSAVSSSPVGTRTRRRSPCSRAASGGGSRSRSRSPPARTSSSSTSPRTTSTSRAARRSRRRSTRSPARCCSSPTTVRCSTRSPSGHWRSRTAGFTHTTAVGPSSCAGARSARPARSPSRRSSARSRPRNPEGPKPKPRRAPELERIEAEIAVRETEVAELERKLAEDWTDVDVLAAHKRSRDALTTLLARWEQLFDQAQA